VRVAVKLILADIGPKATAPPADCVLAATGRPRVANLIRMLHTDLTVRMSMGEVEVEIPSTVGVKQGDMLAANPCPANTFFGRAADGKQAHELIVDSVPVLSVHEDVTPRRVNPSPQLRLDRI
jgi:hypothetical protein